MIVYNGKHTFRVRGVFCPEDPAPLKGGYAVYKLLNMPLFFKKYLLEMCIRMYNIKLLFM